MHLLKHLLSSLLLLLCLSASAQRNGSGQTDSVVVLMNAKSIQLLEQDGQNYRQALEARFLHNNTYLICDTALWNVEKEIINARGHVQILQDNTVLTSDELEYVIKIDVARFRGSLVQLQDKEGNILRTRYLDYNTKDSTAFFDNGGSMKDKSGQVIESAVGSYDSKAGLFVFNNRVDMYSDSVFINTSRLDYHTDTETAYFEGHLDAWKDDNMISSDRGYYDKGRELFFFEDRVHVMSPTQEGWADSMYFNKLRNDLDMMGNVQLTDTTRKVSGLSDRLQYVDSLSEMTMTGNATVIARTDQGGTVDTVWFGADRLKYWTVPKCDVPAPQLSDGESRLSILRADPVAEYRKKAAEEAAKAAAAAENEKSSGRPGTTPVGAKARQADVDALKIENTAAGESETSEASGEEQLQETGPEQELQAASDSLATPIVLSAEDSLRMRRDSLRNRDTTAIGFMTALGRVRVFKRDMQMACDSLEYSDIDSVARLYVSPLVWNEGNRQYSADSIYVGVKNQKMDRANLMSNAFIVIEETPDLCYDQIKSTEISAYFDTTTALTRFDALGGANALFYIEENEELATVNKVETKMLSARFVDGSLDKLYYFDSPKNDAYPVVQLPEDEKRMKGFMWNPELRPSSPEDITGLSLRESQRAEYLGRPMCRFIETDRYFPGHIESIQAMLASRDSIRKVRHQEAQMREGELRDSIALEAALNPAGALRDSLAATTEELARMDSLAVIADAHLGISLSDSLGVSPGPSLTAADTLAPSDSLGVEDQGPVMSIAELRAAREAEKQQKAEAAAKKKAELEARRQAKADAKEARWADLDRRDAEKAARKAAKALEKKRKRTLAAVIAADKTAARDQARLMRYVKRYRDRQEAAEARRAGRGKHRRYE